MTQLVQMRVHSVSTLMGDEVRGPNDEELGRVEDLMLDVERGCVSYAVVSLSGAYGSSDRLLAVPWAVMQVDAERHVFRLDADPGDLEDAPGFSRTGWPQFADVEWMESVYDFYAVDPYW